MQPEVLEGAMFTGKPLRHNLVGALEHDFVPYIGILFRGVGI